MKKWNVLISMLLLVGVVFTTSCSKDEEEDPGPSLNLKGGEGYTSQATTISAGETILVGILATSSPESGSNLKNFLFTATHNNLTETVADSAIDADTFTADYELLFESVGETRLTFKITDKDGMTVTKDFVVTVEDAPVAVVKHEGVELGSWDDAAGSFYASSTNTVFVRAEVRDNPANQALVDFIFFKGLQNANSLAAPSDPAPQSILELQMSGWTTENATLLMKTDISNEDFDAIGDTYNFPDFTGTATIVNTLAVDDVVMFKTVEGKLGLVKVVTLASRGDYGVFDVIVQE